MLLSRIFLFQLLFFSVVFELLLFHQVNRQLLFRHHVPIEHDAKLLPPPTRQNVTKTEILVKDRAFPVWNRTLPCYHPTDDNTAIQWWNRKNLKRPATKGLFFLKLLKTGSTTGSSIHVRIAHNLARRLGKEFEVCKTRHLHGWAGPRMYKFGQRDRHKSFLWTLVRDPTSRYISEFFHFEVSRLQKEPTDANAIHFLRHGKHADHHYLSWLSTRGYRKRSGKPIVAANTIIEDYDFIGILERMDESVVALKILLNISMADVLHISSKTSGGYDDGEFQGKCVKIQPSTLSTGLQEYLATSDWEDYIKPEKELYEAAYRSLDRTIEQLGRDLFEEELAKYRTAQQMVASRCEPDVKLPCSRTGERRRDEDTDCLVADIGCGFDCLDQVATELGLWG
jgi:hypothetical protein